MTTPEERIAYTIRLLDGWLRDESPRDDMMRQAMWENLREIRAALVEGESTT